MRRRRAKIDADAASRPHNEAGAAPTAVRRRHAPPNGLPLLFTSRGVVAAMLGLLTWTGVGRTSMAAQALEPQLAFGSAHSSSQVDYSTRAADPGPYYSPPLPGTEGFSRVRGREGDLLVIQLKGMAGLDERRKAALRTLGLGRIDSACLRDSADPTLWGNVQAVRDAVAVVILPRKMYAPGIDSRAEDSDAQYDSLKYGTQSRPGHLWRDAKGDYFAYESDRDSLVALWSSDCSDLYELLSKLSTAGLTVDKGSHEAQLRVIDRAQAHEERVGPLHELLEARGNVAVSQAVIPIDNGAQVTWQASIRRFHDIDVFRPSVTIASSPPDILATRGLARETAARGFLGRIPCRVRTRINGRVREYPIAPAQT